MNTVVVINRDQMGAGSQELGRKILGIFFRKAIAMEELSALVFYNDGVKLLQRDSPVIAELSLLEERGVDLIPCGTCIDFFGIEVALGAVSDMGTILAELDKAEKVITL